MKYIVYLHNIIYKYKYLLKFNKNNLVLYLVIFFLFVRWDILNSIHSFNTLNFLENYVNYVLIVLSMYLLSIKMFIGLNLINLFYNKLNVYCKIYKVNFVNFIFNTFVYCILFFYYYNIFSVIFYETDIIELSCYLRLLLIWLLILLTIFFLNQKKSNIFLIIFIFFIFMLNFNLSLFFFVFYTYVFYGSYIKVHLFVIILSIYTYLSNMLLSYYFILPQNMLTFNYLLSVDCFKIVFDSLNSTYKLNILDTPIYILSNDVITFFNLQLFNYILFFNSGTNFLQNFQVSSIGQLNLILTTTNIYGLLYFCFILILTYTTQKKPIILLY